MRDEWNESHPFLWWINERWMKSKSPFCLMPSVPPPSPECCSATTFLEIHWKQNRKVLGNALNGCMFQCEMIFWFIHSVLMIYFSISNVCVHCLLTISWLVIPPNCGRTFLGIYWMNACYLFEHHLLFGTYQMTVCIFYLVEIPNRKYHNES